MQTKILLVFIISFFSLNAKEINDNILEKENNTAIKNNDVYIMDAAMVDPYGKAHFFIGKFYHKYYISKKFAIASPIVTSSFKKLFANVDAALLHPHNKKGYIFKGTVYYRYNFKTKKIEKEGIIGIDGFKGLQGPFDAALVHPTNNSAYFFKKDKYYRYSFSKRKVDKVGIIGTDGWKGIPKNADAALVYKGKAYFFKGDNYYRYDFSKRKTNQIQLISSRINNNIWHDIFPHIDAAINTKDYRYFEETLIYDLETYSPDRKIGIEVPEKKVVFKQISKIYKGIPSNIDAVLIHPKNKKVYFFIEGQYFRYDRFLRKVDKIGTIGHDGWKKIPASLDGAFTHKNGKVYFFKGTKYYRFNLDTHKIDKIALIKDNWKGVPDNIDAVCNKAYNKNLITFYKKTVEYVYDISKKKVVQWNSFDIDKIFRRQLH